MEMIKVLTASDMTTMKIVSVVVDVVDVVVKVRGRIACSP